MNNCNNNGKCNEGICECNKGWIGIDCAIRGLYFTLSKGCKDFCNLNGVCNTQTWSCECNVGFKGEYCDYGVCPAMCFGNGICTNDGIFYINIINQDVNVTMVGNQQIVVTDLVH